MDAFCPFLFHLIIRQSLFLMLNTSPFLIQPFVCLESLENSYPMLLEVCLSSAMVLNLMTLSQVSLSYTHLFDTMTLICLNCCYHLALGCFFILLRILKVKFCFWLILYDLMGQYLSFCLNFFSIGILLFFQMPQNSNFFHSQLSKACFLFHSIFCQFALSLLFH